jgi:uncharacterized protein (TIGR00369 family)
MVQHYELKLAHFGDDYVEVTMEIAPANINWRGGIHGGVHFTLADVVTGMASMRDGATCVTLSGDLNIMSNAGSGTVHARATTIHEGRRTRIERFELTTDDGKLLSAGQFTLFVVDPDQLKQELLD